MSKTIYQIPSIKEEWIKNRALSFEKIDPKDTELVSQMIENSGWKFVGTYEGRNLIYVIDFNGFLIKDLYLIFTKIDNIIIVGIINPSIKYDFVLQIKDAEINIPQSVDLKILNSDGRINCAKCNGLIMEPYPSIRYCPTCES